MDDLTRRNALKLLALGAPAAAFASRASAKDNWPTKSVEIIMGFGAGGGADSMARPIFQSVSETLGQTMIVENRTGGNSVVAASAVLHLPANGYAFFLNGLQQIVNRYMVKGLPFDYATSFVPVSQLCSYPQTFAVATGAPWKTMQDLVDYARENPGKVRYGTAGIGGIPYMLGQLLQIAADIEMVNVPYTHSTDIATDVAAGRLDMSILTTSTIGPMFRAGKVRILAVGNDTRSKLHPDVPTMAEIGFDAANVPDWSGLFARTDTPEDIINQMQGAIAKATKDPDVHARVDPQGTILVGSTPSAFATFLKQQEVMVKRVVEKAHLTPQ